MYTTFVFQDYIIVLTFIDTHKWIYEQCTCILLYSLHIILQQMMLIVLPLQLHPWWPVTCSPFTIYPCLELHATNDTITTLYSQLLQSISFTVSDAKISGLYSINKSMNCWVCIFIPMYVTQSFGKTFEGQALLSSFLSFWIL